MEKKEVLHQICDVINSHQSFLICGHIRPDGDCLGSALGLYFSLRQLGKTVQVFIPGLIQKHYMFLPGIEVIRSSPDETFKQEVVIFVDCSSIDRVFEDDITPEGIIVNIDHHQTNKVYGNINYIDPSACAVGAQIFEIVHTLGLTFTPEISNNLFLAILADTGGFKYSNTTTSTFEIAAQLCRYGANPSWVAQEFYSNVTLETVQITAEVLKTLHFEFDGKLLWSEITQEIYQKYGGEQNEPESLVGELRRIKGVEVAILIHELSEGGLRASFRSRGAVDVSKIASELGGGGHPNASGCYIRGDYQALKQKLLDIARTHLSNVFNVVDSDPRPASEY
ncbi:bifunctional oligoribonuclease/PAP phosphatase NrnA [Candidatus Sumerlaeota bacterium]|nr:bifunctional oligoribonuclease/PAP phosphatase NrnA [Candidatus Sumerlaeota bacterium]